MPYWQLAGAKNFDATGNFAFSSQKDRSMPEQPIGFLSENALIVGMLHTPDSHSDTLVIMCHGFTGNKQENKRLFVEAARAFTGAGFSALRFDFYGSGDSAGDFADSSISHNRANLRDAIAFARDKDYAKIIVLGISMGAATAIVTVKAHPVAALVLWSTVPDFRQLFASLFADYQEKIASVDAIEYDGWFIKKNFWEDSLQYDIQSEFKDLSMPKLIVQGTADAPLFVTGFQTLQKIAMPPADFYEIPAAGHTFQTVAHRRQVIQTTLTWLKRHV